jgi:hypothetical protein
MSLMDLNDDYTETEGEYILSYHPIVASVSISHSATRSSHEPVRKSPSSSRRARSVGPARPGRPAAREGNGGTETYETTTAQCPDDE